MKSKKEQIAKKMQAPEKPKFKVILKKPVRYPPPTTGIYA